MTVGQFKKWLEENSVPDEAELYVNHNDHMCPGDYSLDSPWWPSYKRIGIATKNPVTIATVVFN